MIQKIRQSVLFKSTFIYVLTQIINKAVPFLLLPVLTMYLSPRDYGIVATYGAFTAILAVFIHLSLVGAVNVNFFKFSKEYLKVYIANVLLIVFISALIVFSCIYLFQDQLSLKLDIPSVWLFIGLFITLAQFLTTLNLGLWQVEQQSKPFGVYQITLMLTNTSMILILVVGFGMGWRGQLIGQAIATVLFALLSFGFIYRRGYLQFIFNKVYIKDALKFGVPLIPHALSGWFRTGVDRLFLTTLIGSSATGIYSVGYQFGLIVGIVSLAFNQAYSPYLYKKLNNITLEDKVNLVKFTYVYFIGILLFAGIISVITPWIVVHLLNERYLASVEVIPWIAFGYAFQGMYFMVVNYIFFEKKTYMLALVTFLSGIVHVILSYTFIHIYGAVGIPYATTLSFFIMFILVWILSSKVYPMPWNLRV